MNKKSLVIFSSLFVIALFFMSACENEAVGSRLKQNVAEGGGGSPLVMKDSNGCSVDSDCPSDGYVGAFFCQNGDVYRNFRDYSCAYGNCNMTTSQYLIDDCGVNEECIPGQGSCQPVGNGTGNYTLPEMQAIGSGGGGSNNSSNRTG